MVRQLTRRRRRERLGGIALALLGVAVLVIAVYAVRDPNGHGARAGAARTTVTATPSTPSTSTQPAPTSTPSGASPTSTAASSPAAGKLPLVVLNNTLVRGLAQRAQARFEAGGWTVTHIGNLTNEIVSTCAYYDAAQPGAEASARALQEQFPAIKRVAPKFAELPAGPIVVVLTPDYS